MLDGSIENDTAMHGTQNAAKYQFEPAELERVLLVPRGTSADISHRWWTCLWTGDRLVWRWWSGLLFKIWLFVFGFLLLFDDERRGRKYVVYVVHGLGTGTWCLECCRWTHKRRADTWIGTVGIFNVKKGVGYIISWWIPGVIEDKVLRWSRESWFGPNSGTVDSNEEGGK